MLYILNSLPQRHSVCCHCVKILRRILWCASSWAKCVIWLWCSRLEKWVAYFLSLPKLSWTRLGARISWHGKNTDRSNVKPNRNVPILIWFEHFVVNRRALITVVCSSKSRVCQPDLVYGEYRLFLCYSVSVDYVWLAEALFLWICYVDIADITDDSTHRKHVRVYLLVYEYIWVLLYTTKSSNNTLCVCG